MIRFLYLNAFIAVHSLIFCVGGILLSLFDREGRIIHFYLAVPWAKAILRVCSIKVRVTGQENLDPTVPRIYMANHQSYFDIFALLAYVPVDFKFLMKEELMKIPFLGAAMRRAGYIGIERRDPRKGLRSMRRAAERVRNGVSVVVFPEGTRSIDGRLLAFKKGGFNLALKSGCDIIPVSISNSYRIVPKGSLKINKGSFDIHIGRPISVRNYARKNIGLLMDKVKETISRQMVTSSPDHGKP
jgi:1-acyl-sn-glycerol-3-phosphate acyltransferase